MAKTRRYKKIEKSFVLRISNLFKEGFSQVKAFSVKIFNFLDSKLTIMIVPHSHGKVINIQTNIFAVILAGVVTVGIISSFLYFDHRNKNSDAEIARLKEENRETLASLDELRTENNKLMQSATKFQNSLSHSLALLGINQTNSTSKINNKSSDLSSLFNTQDISNGTLKETADVKQLTEYLESAVTPVEEMGKMIENQGTLFTDIPNIWPIKNGIGHISMSFGQNVHPITQQWYIHKGLDFSTYRSGDPVIATANGQVVSCGWNNSFGNTIIIKHKHGIYTRYAHLSTIRVRKGDMVSQRQVIGTIGNTGISTGPHLHYEVHIGADVVDPAKFINIR